MDIIVIISHEYLPRSGWCILYFIRNCQTIFQSTTKTESSSCFAFSRDFILSFFKNLSYSNRCTWYLFVDLICHSLMNNAVEHFLNGFLFVFVCFCHLHLCFSKVFVQIFCTFLIGPFVFLLLSFKCCLYVLVNSPLSAVLWKYFLSVYGLCFHFFFKWNDCKTGILNFDEI